MKVRPLLVTGACLATTCLTLAACSLDGGAKGADLQDAALQDKSGGAVTAGISGGSHAASAGSDSGGISTGTAGQPGDRDARVADASAADGGGFWFDAATDAGPLGYVPGEVGAPCGKKSDCETDRSSRTCFTADFFAPLLTLPGGYCGKLCDVSKSPPCEQGAACITFPTFPPILACMRVCTTDDDCRVAEGYSCNKPFTSTSSVCSLRN